MGHSAFPKAGWFFDGRWKKRYLEEERNRAKETVKVAMEKRSAMKKGSKEKAEYEEELLRKASIATWYQDEDDERKGRDLTQEESELYGEIATLVYRNFGDWSSSEGANDRSQKIIDEARDEIEKLTLETVRKKYGGDSSYSNYRLAEKEAEDKILGDVYGEVLKTIGFEDTAKNRYYIQGYLFVD